MRPNERVFPCHGQCGRTVMTRGIRALCRVCKRASWRLQKRVKARRKQLKRYELRGDLSPRQVDVVFAQALRAIRAQRRSGEFEWKSQAAAMVEAA